MTVSSPTERLVEDVAAVYFQVLGIANKNGADLDDTGERNGVAQFLLPGRVSAALRQLNPDLPDNAFEQVIRSLSHHPHPTLIQNNRWFHTQYTDGVEVEYRESITGEIRGRRARLIDFDNPQQNDLLVARQMTFAGPSGAFIRPDLTVFLNGLPVAVIELKDPSDKGADLNTAIGQLGRYVQTAPDLFVPNLFLAVSDGLLTRVGSITSEPARRISS